MPTTPAMKDSNMDSTDLYARHWIGGDWVDSPKRLDSINPATAKRIGTYADGGSPEAAQAIKVALQTFRKSDWRENRALRAKVLNEMADRFEERTDDLIEILRLKTEKLSGRLDLRFKWCRPNSAFMPL